MSYVLHLLARAALALALVAGLAPAANAQAQGAASYKGTQILPVLCTDETGAYTGCGGGAAAQAGSANLGTLQATATTTSAQLCPARSGRRAVTLVNITGTGPVYFGPSGVSTTTGGLLAQAQGSSFTLNTAAAIFGVVPTTSQVIACVETY